MLRDKNLVPLSRQHQHALALCVRLERGLAGEAVDLEAWQAEIQQIFEQEVTAHFTAEERDLFPAAARFPELRPMVKELIAEHAVLRDLFARAAERKLDSASLEDFADTLAAHIRKEERQLFETLQELLSPEEINALGAALERSLAAASQSCLLPTEATRLRPKG